MRDYVRIVKKTNSNNELHELSWAFITRMKAKRNQFQNPALKSAMIHHPTAQFELTVNPYKFTGQPGNRVCRRRCLRLGWLLLSYRDPVFSRGGAPRVGRSPSRSQCSEQIRWWLVTDLKRRKEDPCGPLLLSW